MVTCDCCGLSGNYSQIVVGRGNPSAELMLIGEAPGAKEDELGVPFVGRSGKLLEKLFLSAGINSDEEVYLCNVAKCRPPKNRKPTKSELESSMPWLYQQIKLVDPTVILLAGATSVEALLGTKGGMSKLRGTWQHWQGRMVMPLFHPSYLLRNPSKQEGKPISLTILDLIKAKNSLSCPEHSSLDMPRLIRKRSSNS